jgi:hypothetical protein
MGLRNDQYTCHTAKMDAYRDDVKTDPKLGASACRSAGERRTPGCSDGGGGGR